MTPRKQTTEDPLLVQLRAAGVTPAHKYKPGKDPVIVQLRELGILTDDQLLRIASERAVGRLDMRRRSSRAPHERRALDAYYTPRACALACVRTVLTHHVNISGFHPVRVVEPQVGDGAWVEAIRAELGARAHVVGYDIDPGARGLEHVDEAVTGDWLTHASNETARAHLIVGNPPFSGAREHVEAAIATGATCAFLLRIGFLASRSRRDLWRESPPTAVYSLVERPGFLGVNGKTDSQEYALFVWQHDVDRLHPLLDWISWQTSAPGSTSAPEGA